MKKCLAIILILTGFSFPQSIDTTKIENIKNLQTIIDSLAKTIIKLDNELQLVKKEMVTGSNKSDDILDLLTMDGEESMPEDQRSKKKRVDDLLRAIQQRPGQLRFNGGATTTLQGNLGQSKSIAMGVGSFDIYAFTSFGANTLLFFDLEAIGGNGPDEFFPTFSNLNGDAGSTQDGDGLDRINVLEAWGEFTLLDEMFTITAGKIDLTNYFDNNASANDETLQFLSGPFINSTALAVVGNSPGVRIRTTLFNTLYIQFGFSSVDNSGSKLFGEIFKIGSVGYRLFPESEWEANLRVYAYQHPSANNSMGFGISFDETVLGKYKLFARYGKNNNTLSDWFGISSAWSTGLSFIKTINDRGINLGLAYGETIPHSSDLKSEKLLELYARYQFNKWIYTSPHFQFVWNSLGSEKNYIVFGLRTHFNF